MFPGPEQAAAPALSAPPHSTYRADDAVLFATRVSRSGRKTARRSCEQRGVQGQVSASREHGFQHAAGAQTHRSKQQTPAVPRPGFLRQDSQALCSEERKHKPLTSPSKPQRSRAAAAAWRRPARFPARGSCACVCTAWAPCPASPRARFRSAESALMQHSMKM